MRVLLSVDGSPYSGMATSVLEALRLSTKNEVTVLAVIPEVAFLGRVALNMLRRSATFSREEQQKRAAELIQGSVDALSAARLKTKSLVRWGDPAEVILKTAEEIDASLVVLGAKGLADSPRFLLGGTAQKVMRYARCSVLLTRETTTNIKRVLLGTDGSEYSDITAQFLLTLPLPRRSEVAVVTAFHSNVAALMGTPTLDPKINQQLLADLEAAEESHARELVTSMEEQFHNKGYRTTHTVMRGEAAESILVAAEKYRPDIIALGAKGLTGIESFLIGSVTERVARHAQCSVLIGRV